MQAKDGVILAGLQLECRPILIAAAKIWERHGEELVITSGLDGVHSPGSLHPYGYALDLRTRYFSAEAKKEVHMELKEELRAISTYYDVILHSTHIHAEFDIIRARSK